MASPIRCWSCGYDVSGRRLGEPCPECGRQIVYEREVLDHQAAAWRRSRFLSVCVVIGGIVVLNSGCSMTLAYCRVLPV
ncbi:MAG: hypothetical protein WD749_06995 [Phycisphaerales bacterium]